MVQAIRREVGNMIKEQRLDYFFTAAAEDFERTREGAVYLAFGFFIGLPFLGELGLDTGNPARCSGWVFFVADHIIEEGP